MTRALREAEQAADVLEGRRGDDRLAHEVYGMPRLSAALAREIRDDHAGAAARAAEAGRVADRLGEQPDESSGEGWQSFGPANVGTWRTMLAVEAGEPPHGQGPRRRPLQPVRRA